MIGDLVMEIKKCKLPTKAKLLIHSNQEYLIEEIHFDTNLITLKERDKVYNTVSIKNVEIDFSKFTSDEIVTFWRNFEQ